MVNLYLIDGQGMAYRAFYAISNLSTSKGMPTNAIYGFSTMLLKVLKEDKPDYLCILFDSKEKTFRHNLFSEYKAQRKKMPEDMKIQMPIISEVIKALGCFSISLDGYEADDIIASCVKRFKDKVDKIYILTQDKDILSLVSEKVEVVSYKKGSSEKIIFDKERVIEKFGVSPSCILDLLALIGDTSDNIPGAKGIGEKTGVSLIKRYKSLDNILKNPQIIGEKNIGKIIAEEKGNIELSKKLVSLKDDLPLPFSLSDLKIKDPDKKSLLSLFSSLEFKTLIDELSLKDKEEREESPFSLISKPVAISLSLSGDKLLIGDKTHLFSLSFNEAKKFLEDLEIEKYGYDLKSFILLLKNKGIELKGNIFDIMIASYLLNPGLKHDISDIFLRHLPEETPDAIGIFRVKEVLENKMKKEGLFSLFNELETPLIRILAGMEDYGIRVDKEYLETFKIELSSKISSQEEKIYSFAGEFNINSPKQLSFILFEKLSLPVIKRKKTGPSTDEEVLVSLSRLHPLPGLILEYRELAKLKSTYVDGIIDLIGSDGRVHTSFNQAITATGRLSCSNPNLQNIPVKTELGKKIRRAFIPDFGNVFLKADYSQIELRLLAHISGDSLLISSFLKDEDIHSNTASEIYGIPKEKITGEMRRQAKTINFGIIYGMSSYGLSKELGISTNAAQEMIDRYFKMHPGVLRYIENTIKEARELGYVKTLSGRKRYIPEILSKNKQIREFGERAAINMPIQGACADLIKKAMISISKNIKDEAKMLLQVHDELLFELPEGKVSQIAPIVIECMKNVGEFSVPIEVNISVGKNWGEL